MGFQAMRIQLWHCLRIQRRSQSRLSRQIVFCTAAGMLLLFLVVLALLAVWRGSSGLSPILAYFAALKVKSSLLSSLVVGSGYLQKAQKRLEDERDSITTEREAFLEFANRVRSISPSDETHNATPVQLANTKNSSQQLQQIRKQYQKTILALPDHDRVYDESPDEHAAAEFGTELASVLLGGQRFTPQMKQLLVEQAEDSAHQRDQLLDTLTIEKRSLQRAEEELEPVANCLDTLDRDSFLAAGFEELIDTDERFRKHRTACEQVVESRQEEIRTITRKTGRRTNGLFQEYLYSPLEVSFPVIQTALDIIEEIGRQQSSLRWVLCRKE